MLVRSLLFVLISPDNRKINISFPINFLRTKSLSPDDAVKILSFTYLRFEKPFDYFAYIVAGHRRKANSERKLFRRLRTIVASVAHDRDVVDELFRYSAEPGTTGVTQEPKAIDLMKSEGWKR